MFNRFLSFPGSFLSLSELSFVTLINMGVNSSLEKTSKFVILRSTLSLSALRNKSSCTQNNEA